MSTSGGGGVNALLYVVVLVLAIQLGLGRLSWPDGEDQAPGTAPKSRRAGSGPPRRVTGLVAAGAVWLVVAVPSLLQIPFPALLNRLERDPALVKQGQVWRVLTGLVVQDGGIGGTVFNLVILAVVAVVAGQVWGRALPLVFLVTHLSFAVPAVFLSNDVGAGNSGATLGLAATLAGYALATRPAVSPTVSPAARDAGAAQADRQRRGEIARAAGVLGAGIVLVGLRDAHGIPVVAGPLIGVLAATTGKHMADSRSR